MNFVYAKVALHNDIIFKYRNNCLLLITLENGSASVCIKFGWSLRLRCEFDPNFNVLDVPFADQYWLETNYRVFFIDFRNLSMTKSDRIYPGKELRVFN